MERGPTHQQRSIVRDELLLTHDGNGRPTVIVVGSEAWTNWLSSATTFGVVNGDDHFTARKERTRRGGWYWKAYRSARGRLYRVYLGKADTLSYERCCAAGHLLTMRIQDASSSSAQERLPVRRSTHAYSGGQAARPAPFAARAPHPRGAQSLRGTLLEAKTQIPPPPSASVLRPQMLAWLDQATEHALTVLVGPAGAGKTTALAHWASARRATGAAVAWVSLDTADNDPARCWRHVLTALERILPGSGRPGLTLLDQLTIASSAPFPTETLAAAALDALAPLKKPLYLILDDYQGVTAPDIHTAVTLLAEHASPSGHVVIASREALPFATARLRVADRVVELDADYLRFTHAEAHTFLRARVNPPLDDEVIDALHVSTDGWIAGLQLAALALKDRPTEERSALVQRFVRGAFPTLEDYFLEEVLGRLEPTVYEFLLRTSLLDRLCGPLCDHVTGRRDGQTLLEQLERAQLFLTPVDGARCWYRYHPLFAEVLRVRLARERPGLAPHLHAAITDWYLQQQDFAEAVPHALASGNAALAATVIERAAPSLERWGETTTLLGWFVDLDLPSAVLRQRPHLQLLYARLLLAVGRVSEACLHLDQVELSLGTLHAQTDTSSVPPYSQAPEIREVRAQAFALRSDVLMVEGDYRGALQAATKGLSVLDVAVSGDAGDAGDCGEPEGKAATASDGGRMWRAVLLGAVGALHAMLGELPAGLEAYRAAETTSRAIGDIPSLLENVYGQGSVYGAQGRLRDAATAFRRAVDLAEAQPQGPPPVAGASYWCLARVLYEWDERPAAWRHLRASISLDRRYGDLGLLLRCYLVQGRLYLAEDDHDGLRQTFDHITTIATAPQTRPRIAHLAAAIGARLSLAAGDIERAEDWERQVGLSLTDTPSYRTEFEHITLLRLLLVRKQFNPALDLSARLLMDAAATGRLDKTIELETLRTLAFSGAHNDRLARECLTHALALAEPGGYVRLFADEDHRLRPVCASLLSPGAPNLHQREHQQADYPSERYLDRIAAALGVEAPPRPAEAALSGAAKRPAVILSERELEVLRHVDAGLSDAQIANELVVEVSTVKWHLHNMFQKLGARRRTQALAVARLMDLL